MTYLIKHDKQGPFRKTAWTVGLLVFLLCLVLAFGYLGFLRELTSNIFSPILKVGNNIYGSFACSNQDDVQSLETIDYKSVILENQKLREELGLKPKNNSLAASVVGKPPQTPIGSIFLDRGADDDLKEGDLVLASDRALIGKITEVTSHRSIASLSSSAGAVSYGFVARTGEQIEIKGSGGNSMGAEVSIDFDLIPGDEIMMNDSSSYLLAVVGVVEPNQASGLKKIYLSLPVSISKINTVFVVKSN